MLGALAGVLTSRSKNVEPFVALLVALTKFELDKNQKYLRLHIAFQYNMQP